MTLDSSSLGPFVTLLIFFKLFFTFVDIATEIKKLKKNIDSKNVFVLNL